MLAFLCLCFVFAFWMKGGTLLVDNSGQPIECADCMCDCICDNCVGPACPSEYTLVIEDVANLDCTECAGGLNGEFNVTRDLGLDPTGCCFKYTFSPPLCNGTGSDIDYISFCHGLLVGPPTEYPISAVFFCSDGTFTLDNFPYPTTPETCDLNAYVLAPGAQNSFACDISAATVTVQQA